MHGKPSDLVVGGPRDCNTSPASVVEITSSLCVPRGCNILHPPPTKSWCTLPSSRLLRLPTSPSPRRPFTSSSCCSSYLLLLLLVVVEGKKKERKKIRERERSLARGWRAGGQWGEKQEKLHPFESHPRTPSGLKKSIKRREPAAVRGGRKRGRERERERRAEEERWGIG